MSFDKIPGQSGYLVLSLDGAILSSGGELENDEKTATNIFKFVSAGDLTFKEFLRINTFIQRKDKQNLFSIFPPVYFDLSF